jgi:hydroxypyruvate isomerase
MKLSICIEMFWTNLAFEQRILLTQKAGYSAFEFWNWSNKDLEKMRAAQEETGLACAGMVSEPGFGLVRRDYDAEHVDGVVASAKAARGFDCSTLIVTTGNVVAGESWEITRRRVVRKLRKMAEAAEGEGVTLVLEPLNPFVDHAGYWLTTMAQAADLIHEVDSPNLKILYDIYHQQVTEGKIIANLKLYAPWIGHIHTAGVPGRHELAGGDLDYRAIFAAIDAVGYTGYTGLEFRPTRGEGAALAEAMSLVSAQEQSTIDDPEGQN